jgi:hypothetical protein
MDRYTTSPFARTLERRRRTPAAAAASGGGGGSGRVPAQRTGSMPQGPQVPAQRTGATGAGRGGGAPPPTAIASGGEQWNHPDHERAMQQLGALLERRRTKAVGGLDEAIADLEQVRQRLRISGVIDEQFKRFDKAELAIAELLARDGSNVTALLESTVQHVKTADAAVGAIRTEFKTLTSPDKLRRELKDAADKSLEAVVDVTGMRITRQAAVRIAGEEMRGTTLRRVRILGGDYNRGGGAYDVWVEQSRGKR